MQPLVFQWAIILWIAVIVGALGFAIWVNWKLKAKGDKTRSSGNKLSRARTIGRAAEADEPKPRLMPLDDNARPSLLPTEPPNSTVEVELVGSAREPRYSGSFRAQMRQQGGKPITVKVWDLSAGGFRAEWPHKLHPGDLVFFAVGGTASQVAKVIWSHDFVVGCKFETRLHDAVLSSIVKRASEDTEN